MGRVLLVVFGVIVGLIGVALLAGGGGLLYADLAVKGSDGFYTTRTEAFLSPARAIVTEKLDLTGVPGGTGRWGTLRVHANGAGDRPVFVGIGRKDDVQRYLSGVPYTELTDVDLDPFHPTYRAHPGSQVPAPPSGQTFWAAQVQGAGPQTLTWGVSGGDWQIVTMNPDGSAGVAVNASVGVKIPHVLAVAIGLLVAGVILLALGIWMIVRGARSRTGPPAPVAAPAGDVPPPA